MTRYIAIFQICLLSTTAWAKTPDCRKVAGFVTQLEAWAAHNASWASSAAWHEVLAKSGLLTAGQLSEIQPVLGNLFKQKQAESTKANKPRTDKILKALLAYTQCGKKEDGGKGNEEITPEEKKGVYYYKCGDDSCSFVNGYLMDNLVLNAVSTDPKPCGQGKEKLDPRGGLTWIYENAASCQCKFKETEKIRNKNEEQ